MKANELMIGDWVKIIHHHKPKPLIIVKKIDLNDFRDALLQVYPEITYEPIPLTPEILEKNGFNKPQDAGDGTLICGITIGPYKLTFQSVFGLPILTIENVVDNDNNHTCLVIKDGIYNVHELQHALRLCGIEKEIVL